MNWKTLSSVYLFNDRWFKVRKEVCETPDGKIVDPYYVYDFATWVGAFALTEDGKVIMVKQYRHALGETCIEIPGGCVDDTDKSNEEAIARELLEETGWQAAEVKLLMVGPSSAGMSTEMIGFARARGLVKVHDGGGDDSEDITVHEVPLDSAPQWLAQKIREGYSMDPKLWAGLWLLERDPDGSAI